MNLKKLLSDGTIAQVSFYKKDGSLRKMSCRLGVVSHLKGGEQAYNPADYGLLTVFDMTKKAYRNINVNTIVEVKHRGKVYPGPASSRKPPNNCD